VGNHRSSENVYAATLIDMLPPSPQAHSGFFHLAPIARAAK
jgi:hypothetical protein